MHDSRVDRELKDRNLGEYVFFVFASLNHVFPGLNEMKSAFSRLRISKHLHFSRGIKYVIRAKSAG